MPKLFKKFTPRPLLEQARLRLAREDALWYTSLLGLITGLLAGLVILAFRLLIEIAQTALLPGGGVENYEALSWWARLLLPTLGGLLVGVLLYWCPAEPPCKVGIVHVMKRLAYHQGHLPWWNALLQFFGASLSIIAGHSVGREGPGVHLGAASGSGLGQALRLPNNSIRTLVACGTAAAIAASFNTPLAGVIFAMEVVMMEYTILGFTPVILAAVSGSLLAQLVYGPSPAFAVPDMRLNTPLLELGYLVLMGIFIGLLAVAFTRLLGYFTRRWQTRTLWKKTTLAGLATGLVALWVPEIMGIGYDTVDAVLANQLGVGLMLTLVIAKLLITTLGLGLGLPGGLIGPTLVIGAAAGGLMGSLAHALFPDQVSSQALYATLGMGAMMSATLQAPLAALTALLELTGNLQIVMPAMLVIVISNLIAGSWPCRQPSVFIVLMRSRGLDYRHDPLAQYLRRFSVISAMERDFSVQPRYISWPRARELRQQAPLWIMVRSREGQEYLFPGADLDRYLQTDSQAEYPEQAQLDLMEIPAQRQQLAPISLQATLQEARDLLGEAGIEALYVVHRVRGGEPVGAIYGMLTRQNLEAYYRR